MNCLELFAGCGGAALGLRRAGFESIACVEADKWAVATLEVAGFPAVRAWIGDGGPADIPMWTPPDVSVDLLWASPPCQPYSMAGKREGADDARDGWPATLAAIERVRPTWFIIENVVGAPVEEWTAAVALLGYTVSYRILDAADWGLPSHRRRIFLVGGPHEYRWPVQTHYGPRYPWILRLGKSPWNGWGAAIGHAGAGPDLLGPAPTICTDSRGTGGSRDRGIIQSAMGRDRLTLEESIALMGFIGHPFQGPARNHHKQVGNAVAPVMAEALGRAIMEQT